MKWNKLPMADKAKYIQLGVQNGITDLSKIREVYNSYAYDGNIYDGTTEDTQQMDRILTTGNEYGDIAASFVPFVGTAMDWETAIREPSIGNYAWALGSTALDLIGGSLIKGAAKSVKAYKAFKAANKLSEAAQAARKGAERAIITDYKKYTRLTKEAQKLETRARELKGDTRIFGMGDTPTFYDAIKQPVLLNTIGSAYNGTQLGIGALYNEAYPNGIEEIQ